MNSRFLLDVSHPALRDHTVYGQHLLPGLAYIDFLYQLFRAEGHDPADVELRNLTIYRPLLVRAGQPLLCEVDATPDAAGVWQIAVHGLAGAADAQRTLYVAAQMHRAARGAWDATLDLARARQATAVALDDIYARCRAFELVQTGFMKAEGTAYFAGHEMVAELRASADGLADADRLMFHPALMDAAGVCAASALARSAAAGEPRLALPVHWRSFKASALVQRRCFVRVRTASMTRRHDVRYVTIELFDESGRAVAELADLAAKLVRDPGLIDPARAQVPGSPRPRPARSRPELNDLVRRLVAQRARRPSAQVDVHAGFYEMGLDSVALLELVQEIDRALGTALPPTLFFEHATIADLAGHLVEICGAPSAAAATDAAPPVAVARAASAHPPRKVRAPDIAIIAIAGRHPQAPDLETFWQNLRSGKDCVTDVPVERWDQRACPRAGDGDGGDRSWGGFIEGVDEFDPLFFGIAPAQARLVDPQVRLFLQTVWHLLESAGYTRARLRVEHEGSVGVYVGAMYQHYGALETADAREPVLALASYGAIANRVSYWFGFNGPSVAVDTMCSSSMTALHLACKDLIQGECRLAIAGGVNLSLHRDKYVGLGQLQLLASRRERRSFADGDGFIPAEAVGAVLLKPLTRAIEDGDDILAVIKGSASNHAGRSSGFAVPALDAQTRLVRDALRSAEVHPRAVSYVEAAATGAALSDAVEVAALQKVFGEATDERGFCALGSVKSNIGHAEAASGMTQLVKVVLQLRHGQLAPSIQAVPWNPHLRLDETAFYLQRELTPWARPTVITDGTAREQPRLALINSFGAGGSNVSVVVEEYLAAGEHGPAGEVAAGPQVVPLSARDSERLRVLAERVLARVQQDERLTLADLAYTLQCGREAMESRLAVVASDRRELVCALEAFLRGSGHGSEPEACAVLYVGHASDARSLVRGLTAGAGGEALVRPFLVQPDLPKLALLWVHGADVPWRELHAGGRARLVPLPLYPFERLRCWLSTGGADRPEPVARAPQGGVEPPRTELERTIATIWEEVLGLAGVGVHDNFLDLGGSSFTGAQVTARLRRQFGVELPVSTLIGPHSTVETLAVAVVCDLARQQDGGAIEAHLDAVAPPPLPEPAFGLTLPAPSE